jgi:phosphoribosylaminoimidazolecarboxamide formyltransferase/IMP cyclohydrolase
MKKFALISVTNKNGVVAFASSLKELGYSILSTGGSADIIRAAGIPVTDVSEFTGHPECLDGRVKTLHPKVHGSILYDRAKETHISDARKLGFENIDVVAVNLYDFEGNASGKNLPLSEIIHHIDIGGPTMLRAAAKCHKDVYVVVDPADYPEVLLHLKQGGDALAFKAALAKKVFQTTARYDAMIAEEFSHPSDKNPPQNRLTHWKKVQTLRYGENSHQTADFFAIGSVKTGLAAASVLQGKELSYNNLIDLDAAAAIVADLDPFPTITIIKHTNPCGTASLDPKKGLTSPKNPSLSLFQRALACDPKCAFGGIVASNIAIDGEAARAISEVFLECVIAPDFTEDALAEFAKKKNLRIVKSSVTLKSGRYDSQVFRSVEGGVLVQSADSNPIAASSWTCASHKQPNSETLDDLRFAMTIARHVKSNAIVLAKDLTTTGIGAGQMSRVDSVKIAIDKAIEVGHKIQGSVAASDAFFPFRDSLDTLAKSGVTAIVQPGGSLRDQESIDAANEHGVILMMSGARFFKH